MDKAFNDLIYDLLLEQLNWFKADYERSLEKPYAIIYLAMN